MRPESDASQDPAWRREEDLDEVRATYRDYDETGRAQLWSREARGFAALLDELDRELSLQLNSALPSGHASVVDLGCGTGELADLAAIDRRRIAWTGVDIRADAIEQASAAYPNARFLVGSADDLPMAAGSVDVVVTRLLFSTLPSTRMEEAVAAEVGRVLRPGGWLVWLDLRYSNPANPAVHGITRDRLAELFAGWPTTIRSTGLLPPIARRMGWVTPFAYPLLSRVPVLRSHLVGRLRRPGAR